MVDKALGCAGVIEFSHQNDMASLPSDMAGMRSLNKSIVSRDHEFDHRSILAADIFNIFIEDSHAFQLALDETDVAALHQCLEISKRNSYEPS